MCSRLPPVPSRQAPSLSCVPLSSGRCSPSLRRLATPCPGSGRFRQAVPAPLTSSPLLSSRRPSLVPQLPTAPAPGQGSHPAFSLSDLALTRMPALLDFSPWVSRRRLSLNVPERMFTPNPGVFSLSEQHCSVSFHKPGPGAGCSSPPHVQLSTSKEPRGVHRPCRADHCHAGPSCSDLIFLCSPLATSKQTGPLGGRSDHAVSRPKTPQVSLI